MADEKTLIIELREGGGSGDTSSEGGSGGPSTGRLGIEAAAIESLRRLISNFSEATRTLNQATHAQLVASAEFTRDVHELSKALRSFIREVRRAASAGGPSSPREASGPSGGSPGTALVPLGRPGPGILRDQLVQVGRPGPGVTAGARSSIGPFTGQVPIPPPPPAAAGPGAAAGGLGPIAALGITLGAVAAAAAALVGGFLGLVAISRRLEDAFRDLSEQLAPFSGDLAGALAERRIAELENQIREAQALGPSLADLNRTQADLARDLSEIKIRFLQILIPFVDTIAEELGTLLKVSSAFFDTTLQPIEDLTQLFGELPPFLRLLLERMPGVVGLFFRFLNKAEKALDDADPNNKATSQLIKDVESFFDPTAFAEATFRDEETKDLLRQLGIGNRSA